LTWDRRLPVSTRYEAEIVARKILNYYSPESLGPWRNIVCFIGDDGDSGLHMSDSESLANIVNAAHREFQTEKIYFDAYPVSSTPAGKRYPGVTDAINQRVKEGVLVLNYVGHANDRFLAEERVLDVSTSIPGQIPQSSQFLLPQPANSADSTPMRILRESIYY
jgi:hypothetical protein